MMHLMVGLLSCLMEKIISTCFLTLTLLRSKNQKPSADKYNLFPYKQDSPDGTLIPQYSNQSHQKASLKTDDSGFLVSLDLWIVHTQKRQFARLKNIDVNIFRCFCLNAKLVNLKLSQSSNQLGIQVGENRSQHMFTNNNYCLNNRWQILLDSAGKVVNAFNTIGGSTMGVPWNKLRVSLPSNHSLHISVDKNQAIPRKHFDNLSQEILLNNRDRYLEALVGLEKCLLSFDGSTKSYQQILQILGQTSNAGRVRIFDYSSDACTFTPKHCTGLVASPKAEWQRKCFSPQLDKQIWKNLWAEVLCPHGEQILSRGESISGTVSHLSSGAATDNDMMVTKLRATEHQCQILESQNILSILILPIIAKNNCNSTCCTQRQDGGEFLGFISFENHLETLTWDNNEIAFLQVAVAAISLAYQNCRNARQSVIIKTGHNECKLESQLQISIALQQEIASREQVQIELEKSRSLQQATLESTADGILVIDNCGNITEFNQKFVEMWGIPELPIKPGNNKLGLKIALSQLKYPKQYIDSIRELHAHPDTQINDAIALKDGRIFERFSQPQLIGGKIVGRVWSFRDITAHKVAEAKIRYQALHDLLTDLPNRVLFNERLADALKQASEFSEQLAVCFLDLDRFKTINDTLGHVIGDQLLQSVSERLTQSLREGDIIARWGGDEFTILLPKIRDAKDAANIQERILAALKPVFEIENHHLHISASIGIALYPVHGEDAETLIKHADVALYRAKSLGRNKYQFYNSAINSQATELLALENSLYHALERHEFTVYYQPEVNITTSKITKMEALLRWKHPELGLISPSKFIPLAEETGLIVPIGEWVLRTACTQTKYWQNLLGLSSLSIAVNLSARQFQQPNLVELIKQILTETQLQPECLELEITETIAMQNIELTIDILNQLNQMGVSISIDDFGTGYCSLSYLKNFPIHTLKIDRSFVRDLTTNTQDAAITTAIIALAHGLNLAVVAEGVETEEQRNVLKLMKCELMQGYLFSCAVSAEDATKLLQRCKSSRVDSSCLVA